MNNFGFENYYIVIGLERKNVCFKNFQKARSFALKCGYRPVIYNPIKNKTWIFGEY